MRFLVEYDERGTIKAIGATSGEDGEGEPHMRIMPRTGHKIATIEVSEIVDENDHANIISIKRKYKIEEHQGRHRLVERV